ncbi:hypothetical protein [Belliella pelovolcani]|uniref:hypothetical protein n=1 Tax=Belliella pelovolcani TaxID=529505 RepID=UPI003919B98D
MPFIILSLKHTEGNVPTFWRPDDAGYTNTPWAAGVYTDEQVKADPGYYNDGYNTLAIPLSNQGLESIGFKCSIDLDQVKSLKKKALIEAGKREVNHG